MESTLGWSGFDVDSALNDIDTKLNRCRFGIIGVDWGIGVDRCLKGHWGNLVSKSPHSKGIPHGNVVEDGGLGIDVFEDDGQVGTCDAKPPITIQHPDWHRMGGTDMHGKWYTMESHGSYI